MDCRQVMYIVMVRETNLDERERRDVVLNPMNHPCRLLPLPLLPMTVKMIGDIRVLENVGVVMKTRKIVVDDTNESTEIVMSTVAGAVVDTEMTGTIAIAIDITGETAVVIAAVETVVAVVVAALIERIDGRGISTAEDLVRTVTVANGEETVV